MSSWMLQCYIAVCSKQLSNRKAAAKYGIPASTLRSDHVTGKRQHRYGGGDTILDKADEKEIERICQVMQEFGFPLSKEFISYVLCKYLDEIGERDRFKHGIPGQDWWSGFLKRHGKTGGKETRTSS